MKPKAAKTSKWTLDWSAKRYRDILKEWSKRHPADNSFNRYQQWQKVKV
jgi:hypothetical protein